MKRMICTAALLLASALPSARAADICRAIVLHDVAAKENAHAILRRGAYDRAITQYSVDRNGIASFCSHGGYCYPTHVVEGGRKIEALRLTNCRITTRKAFEDEDETAYELDVIRSAVTPTELKVDDLDNRLIGLGLCSACANNAAWLSVHKPKSRCAQLTRKALAGNPAALADLKADPAYCQVR
jgi:hypothetical protein